jgi:hypothetical protein
MRLRLVWGAAIILVVALVWSRWGPDRPTTPAAVSSVSLPAGRFADHSVGVQSSASPAEPDDVHARRGPGRAAATPAADGAGRSGASGASPADPRVRILTIPDGVALANCFVASLDGENVDWEQRFDLDPDPDFVIGLATGRWRVVGRSIDGRRSGLVVLSVTSGDEVSATLDFRTASSLTGRVYDGFRVQWLEGATARVVALDGLPLGSEEGGLDWSAPIAFTDALGVFTLAVPHFSSGELELSRSGFATLREPFGAPDERGGVAMEPVPLEPIATLEVQLRASSPRDFTAYSIEPFGARGKTSFSADGRALVELAAWIPQPWLLLLHPDGNGRRIDLPRFPADSSPLLIELDPLGELRVEIEGWPERDPSLEYWVTVTTAGIESNVLEIVSTRLQTDSAECPVATAGHALVALNEYSESGGYVSLDSQRVELQPTGSSRLVRLTVAAASGVRLEDQEGRPLANVEVTLEAPPPAPWYAISTVSDADGRVQLPRSGSMPWLLCGSDPAGRWFFGVEASAPEEPGSFTSLRLGAAEDFEVVLTARGRPLLGRQVTLRGARSRQAFFTRLTDAEGRLGPIAVRAGGALEVEVTDPSLLEFGRSYPMQPGRNVLEVHETGTLELILPRGRSDADLAVTGAELTQWLESGLCRVTSEVLDGSVRVTYSPLPLGSYTCTLDGAAPTTVELARAGQSLRVEL